jgi:hypothetical protein
MKWIYEIPSPIKVKGNMKLISLADITDVGVLPFIFLSNINNSGHAIAWVVSHRLPTAAAQVRAQIRSCGICGERSGTGVGFLRVLRFPLPILIPPTALHSSSSIFQGWYNRPISGRSIKWTQSHPNPRKKN